MSEVQQKVWTLGIDVKTRDAPRLVVRLARLRTTTSVTQGGAYREDPRWSRVFLDTEWDLEGLDDWLWRYSRVDYEGTWEREGETK